MTVNEAAALANKHPETIRRWIREKKLIATKLPNDDWGIAEEDLKRCMNASLVSNLAIAAINPTLAATKLVMDMVGEHNDASVNSEDIQKETKEKLSEEVSRLKQRNDELKRKINECQAELESNHNRLFELALRLKE